MKTIQEKFNFEESPNKYGKVAVLMGGPYAEREVSLMSGNAVLEALQKMRRQAAVISIREVSEEYYMPVGVWLSRENARHALMKTPQKFLNLGEALKNMQSRMKIPLSEWIRGSTLIPKTKHQKKLVDYLAK